MQRFIEQFDTAVPPQNHNELVHQTLTTPWSLLLKVPSNTDVPPSLYGMCSSWHLQVLENYLSTEIESLSLRKSWFWWSPKFRIVCVCWSRPWDPTGLIGGINLSYLSHNVNKETITTFDRFIWAVSVPSNINFSLSKWNLIKVSWQQTLPLRLFNSYEGSHLWLALTFLERKRANTISVKVGISIYW